MRKERNLKNINGKKAIALFLSSLLLFSACSNSPDNDTETTALTVQTPAETEPTAEVTTNKVSAVENQPEETAASNTTDNTGSEEKPPVETSPRFPVPYPAASVENPSLLSEFKKIISNVETAISVTYGSDTLIPLTGTETEGYRLISQDYAKNLTELTDKMYESLKYTFWEDHYGKEIEDILPDYVKETEGGVMLKTSGSGGQTVIEIDTAVIALLDETTAEVKALGKSGDKYIWRTYRLLDGVRGWVVRDFSDETVTGEIAIFSNLLIENRSTLDKIFGNVTAVKDNNGDWNTQLVTIENDPYGHGFYNGLEIEPFMTVEEMKQYVRDAFTKEIAESYISLYINRTYVEKEGKLYIISGSVLPQLGTFSLDNYENRSISSYDVTSTVDWSDGENSYSLPVTIAYESGKWKIDTRLPMGSDRVIDK